MTVRVARRVIEAILADAAAAPDREVCGLLFGSADRIRDSAGSANVDTHPEIAFEIDPAALIEAHRRERQGGAAIVGCYHSHPSGDAMPSERDARSAAANGWLWLIVGGGTLAAYRAVLDGRIHGRFDPVVITSID